jgi:hypothetical protein
MKPDNTFRWTPRSAERSLRSYLGIVLLSAGIVIMAILLCGGTSAMSQEAVPGEEPAPTALGEDVTPMDQSFQEKSVPQGLFPFLKEQMKDTTPFIRDTKLDLNFRTFYFSRDKFDTSVSRAWALGGSLAYRSGWFLDHFGMGAALYTSQPLYAPQDTDGTLLLAPGQEGYTVLGQLYGRVKIIEDNFINIYRYKYNTPFLNENDGRMTPNTFEGYTLTGTYGGNGGTPKFTYGGGYIDKIKPRNSDTFISMSEAAGAANVNRGVVTGGANVSFPAFSIGAIDYYSQDIINIGYAEAKYTASLTEHLGLLFAAQYTDQQSVGGNLLTGSSFNVNQPGVKAELIAGGGILTLAYTAASTGANLQSPWSSYPGYTSVQVQDFNRAGENAFLLKGSYDFSKLGLEGVSAYSLWVHGWNAIDPTTNVDVYNQNEYDFDLQWRPKSTPLKGLWFRIRYAHVDQYGAGDASLDDVRFIVNYDLPLL